MRNEDLEVMCHLLIFEEMQDECEINYKVMKGDKEMGSDPTKYI